MARTAHYEVLNNSFRRSLQVSLQKSGQLFCPTGVAEFIAIEKHYKTKDYDFLAFYGSNRIGNPLV